MGQRDSEHAHPTEEAVEEYARGKLIGRPLDEFEEHLLVCIQCQDRVAEADQFVVAMKAATANLQKEKPIDVSDRPERGWLGQLGWFPKPIWAGALATIAVLVIAIWTPWQRPIAYESEVTLQAVRGAEFGVSVVPAGKPFLLKADVTGIPPAVDYKLAIADARGSAVWQATVVRQGAFVSAAVPKKLSAGRYWVRISDNAGALLREFGLETR